MGRIYFSWVIHNHQPEGNFTWVMDEAYEKSYKPFLDFLKHSGLKAALHNSGTLWEYFDLHAPEYVDDVTSMVDKGQLELIGGTFFEAILSTIPDDDKVNQLKLLRDFVEKKFQTPVNGAWVTERVWEPHFPKFYNEAGYHYVFLDDYHFTQAGEPMPLQGYYLTEDQGYQLFVFPIDKKLRYLIPWHSPEEVLNYLKSFSSECGDVYILYADDGEKFGLWQGTHELCYEEKYLDKLLSTLLQGGVEIILPGEVLEKTNCSGLVYLPTCTYPEMAEWSLDEASYERYRQVKEKLTESEAIWLHGGFWRRFLKSHPESRWMYGRVVSLSRYLNNLAPRHPRKNKALMELYRAEANDVFWHGVFGGLYLSHLRRNLYHRLIRAITTADGTKKSYIDLQDFDLDGSEELKVANDTYHVFVEPQTASIREFDLLRAEENMLDVLDPKGEVHGLFLDKWHGHAVNYTIATRELKPAKLVFHPENDLLLEKVFTFESGFLEVTYKFLKESEFVVEIPVNLWNPSAEITAGNQALPLNEEAQIMNVQDLHWDVGVEHIDLVFSKRINIKLEPIQILHESGLFKEVTYQGTIVTAQFNARGGEEFSAKLYVSEKTERG